MSTKQRLFVMDAFKWAPEGLFTWFLERDQRPGMLHVRENRKYTHEVARKLIEEKRRELKDGTSRKDLLSLLGSSYVLFMKHRT
jgi:cytochrome P450